VCPAEVAGVLMMSVYVNKCHVGGNGDEGWAQGIKAVYFKQGSREDGDSPP
jgi:hypothetical protein